MGKFNRTNYDFCMYCGKLFFKQETLNEHPTLSHHHALAQHKLLFHYNGEILDDIDFMVLSDDDKEKKRVEWGRPKRTMPYQLIDGVYLK